MSTKSTIFTNETLKFVLEHCAIEGKVFLEVGCGEGDFALELESAGASVIALDSDENRVEKALQKGIQAQSVDFLEFEESTHYDVIIFTRSLHHIHQLEGAILKAKRLLKPCGLLLLEEFDIERIDLKTSRWYYDTRTILANSGVTEEAADFVEDSLVQWKHDHHHHHELHGGRKMMNMVEDVFGSMKFSRGPYLYRSICGMVTNEKIEYELTENILRIENKLIRDELILPNGLRIVARK